MSCPHLDLGLLNYPQKSSRCQKPQLSFKENKNIFSRPCLELNTSDKTSVSHFTEIMTGGVIPQVCVPCYSSSGLLNLPFHLLGTQ